MLSTCNQAHNQKKTAAIRSQPWRRSVHLHPTLASAPPPFPPKESVIWVQSVGTPTNARGATRTRDAPMSPTDQQPTQQHQPPTDQPARVIPTGAELPSLRSDRVAAQRIHESQGASSCEAAASGGVQRTGLLRFWQLCVAVKVTTNKPR